MCRKHKCCSLLFAFFILLTVSLFIPHCLAAVAEGVNRALIIGCDTFVTMPSTFPSSKGNVRMMASVLSGGAMNLEKMVTRVDDITSAEMLESIITDTFSEATEDDVSYFYISSHGLWERGERNEDMRILISNGWEEDEVSALKLKEMFDKIHGKIVLILDVCHSGAMIGKGVHPPFDNIFTGEKYKVLCSGGGEEESWFWASDTGGINSAGAGFFSSSLRSGMSSKGGFAADDNRDGIITLSEIKQYLLQNHGASTVVTYPEEDDFPVIKYNYASYSVSSSQASVVDITYSSDSIAAWNNSVDFEFTVLKPTQVMYQLVYHRNNKWFFDDSVTMYDTGFSVTEKTASRKSTAVLTSGRKERSLVLLNADEKDETDYVMLQIMVKENGKMAVVSSHIFAVAVKNESPILEVIAQPLYTIKDYNEMGIVVHHIYPCEMTITVENTKGEVIRYIKRRETTRPQEMRPWGSYYCWNGKNDDGTIAEKGEYIIHASAYIGQKRYEAFSSTVTCFN